MKRPYERHVKINIPVDFIISVWSWFRHTSRSFDAFFSTRPSLLQSLVPHFDDELRMYVGSSVERFFPSDLTMTFLEWLSRGKSRCHTPRTRLTYYFANKLPRHKFLKRISPPYSHGSILPRNQIFPTKRNFPHFQILYVQSM